VISRLRRCSAVPEDIIGTEENESDEGDNMQVQKEGGMWVITKDPQLIDSNGTSGSFDRTENRVRETYEWWTGERWWGQRYHAMKFSTQNEAEQYCEDNFERMSSSR
jgi:hypothetical protein